VGVDAKPALELHQYGFAAGLDGGHNLASEALLVALEVRKRETHLRSCTPYDGALDPIGGTANLRSFGHGNLSFLGFAGTWDFRLIATNSSGV